MNKGSITYSPDYQSDKDSSFLELAKSIEERAWAGGACNKTHVFFDSDICSCGQFRKKACKCPDCDTEHFALLRIKT